MRLCAVSLASLLTACATAPRLAPNAGLANAAADCSCAYSLFVLTTRETRDAGRVADAERLVPTIGYFVAAGEVLSTKEHVEARRAATLAAYDERRSRISSDYAEDVRRRRFLDALAVDLAECVAFQRKHRDELNAAARAHHATSTPESP